MKASRWIAAAGCVAALSACGDDPEPSPDEITIQQVESATAPIEAALANPSGTVEQDRVGTIFEALQNQGAASDAAGYAPGASAAPGLSTQNGDYSSCMTAGANGGSVDLDCATSGEATGSMTYTFAMRESTMYMTLAYNDVCAQGTCINGAGAQKYMSTAAGFSAVLSGDLTVTSDAKTVDVNYGYAMKSDGQTMTIEYVVFVDGQSYVVSIATSSDSYTYEVRGANGSFKCTATQEGEQWTGSCTGTAGDFTF